ncbi:MAG: 30S ribosomal protein S8 [Zetaproteobacteria bacterium]|nr:MAG: 30S ribosomal protein S8 [Zetaproteobacteria bacterium]
MMMDRIADMLTRIRNAQAAGIERVEMPSSKVLHTIAQILKEEGYLAGVRAYNFRGRRYLRLTLRYSDDGVGAIREIRRVSRSGRRVYCGVDALPRVKNGYGIALISTSKGIMTDRKARAAHVGGEVLCTVF